MSRLNQTARYDWDYSDTYQELVKRYEDVGPVEVDFRALVPFGSGVDRGTHLLHSYPAKLLPNIPLFFIHCRQLVRPHSLIYDPFCGTGTVLVEGLMAGHRVAGADSNPLARLIARAKTTRTFSTASLQQSLSQLSASYQAAVPGEFDPVVRVGKWFPPIVETGLGKLLTSIRSMPDDNRRMLFEVSFSQCVRRCSLADPRMSVPVVAKHPTGSVPNSISEILSLFERTAQANIRRLESLPLESEPVYIGVEAREELPQAKANLIVTSPPYAGAQKYIRASSLSIGWLGLAPDSKLRPLEAQNIGREHLSKAEQLVYSPNCDVEAASTLEAVRARNPLRASILSTYLTEMDSAALAIAESLERGGHLVLVMGDNEISGIPVRTSLFVRRIFERAGLKTRVEMVDTIKSRGLMTKRNKTSALIAREHVFVMEKAH